MGMECRYRRLRHGSTPLDRLMGALLPPVRAWKARLSSSRIVLIHINFRQYPEHPG
jgi:hypothetical protein